MLQPSHCLIFHHSNRQVAILTVILGSTPIYVPVLNCRITNYFIYNNVHKAIIRLLTNIPANLFQTFKIDKPGSPHQSIRLLIKYQTFYFAFTLARVKCLHQRQKFSPNNMTDK